MAKKRYLTMEDHAAPKGAVLHCAAWAPGKSADLIALGDTDAQSKDFAQSLRKAGIAAQSLESIALYLQTNVAGKALDKTGSQFLNLAVESICAQADFYSAEPVLSMESYAADPKLALEGAAAQIAKKIKDIYAFIKEKLVAFFKLLAEKMNHYKRNMGNLTRQLSKLEGQLAGIGRDAEPSIGALKPEWWLINLIYLEKGFPRYAEGISDDLSDLLAAHAGLFTKTISKQLKWLKANHQAIATDGRLINLLTVKRDDFLILDAKLTGAALGFDAAEENNVFYRSRELPGGKAFYTHVSPYDQHGILAIDMLASARVQIDEFDPVAYDRRAVQIAEQEHLELTDWYYSLPPEVQELVQAPEDADYSAARVPGSGNRVTIDRAMVLEVLPLVEARKRLAEVKRNLANIEEWYNVVYGEIWKDKTFDNLANDLLSQRSRNETDDEFVYNEERGYQIEVHADQGQRYLRNLVMALLNVMGNATEYTHYYAFNLCESMLNYVEQSLRQYPKP